MSLLKGKFIQAGSTKSLTLISVHCMGVDIVTNVQFDPSTDINTKGDIESYLIDAFDIYGGATTTLKSTVS